jgi:uncharacterized membrane protein
MSKTCPSCGKSLPDDAKFCDGCGAKQAVSDTNAANQRPSDSDPNQYNQNQTGPQNNAPPFGANQSEAFSAEDIEKNKAMAALAYIIFFLPLIACPDSRFGRFHANQGLLLVIVNVGGSIILGCIPILGWFLLPFFYIAVVVFVIMGLINGFNGLAKRLPLFGKFDILK